jgi:hypothetical protein
VPKPRKPQEKEVAMPPPPPPSGQPPASYKIRASQPTPDPDSFPVMHFPSPSNVKAGPAEQPKRSNPPPPQWLPPDPNSPLARPAFRSQEHPTIAFTPPNFASGDSIGDNLPIPVTDLDPPGPFMSGALQPVSILLSYGF